LGLRWKEALIFCLHSEQNRRCITQSWQQLWPQPKQTGTVSWLKSRQHTGQLSCIITNGHRFEF